MLQQPDGLTLLELDYHIAQYGAYSVEPLVRLADIVETHIIQQDLLYDEYCDCFGEF